MTPRQTRERLISSDTWLLEVFLGLYTLVWGLGYANPLVTAFTGPQFAILRQFPGGETAFGLVVALLGATKLAATVYGARSHRALVCMLMGVFWVSITMAIGVPSHWAAGGLPHFALVALANWLVWVRMGQAAGGADR